MGRRVIGRKLPRLITFDAFGTLFTPREPIAKQYSEVASQLGLSGITESAVQSSFRTAFKDESRRHPNYGKASGMLAGQWWANIIRSTFTPFLPPPQTLPAALVPTLLTRFTTSAGYVLYPDVLPFFHRLRQQRLLSNQPISAADTAVGIITNSDDRVPTVLSNLGLAVSPLRHEHGHDPTSPFPGRRGLFGEHDVAFTILSYDVGVEKPGRGIFDAARDLFRRMRLDGEEREEEGEVELVHVGDDLEKDVFGAREAGWRSVLLDREGKYVGDERIGEGEGMVKRVGGLGELEDVLGLGGRAKQ